MPAITYEQATECLAQSIERLTEETRGHLDEDNQSYWDMANGAVLAWRDMFGTAIRAEDDIRIAALIDAMPGTCDERQRGWHLSPVIHLR